MKKLLAMFLALLMLQLPAASLAETAGDLNESLDDIGLSMELQELDEIITLGGEPTEPQAEGTRVRTVITIDDIRGIPAAEGSVEEAIIDLMKALGVACTRQGDEVEMALNLSGEEVLTVGALAEGKDYYVSSNLLGGAVVINLDDIEPLLGNVIDAMVNMEVLPAQNAEEIKGVLAMVFPYVKEFMAAPEAYIVEALELDTLDFSALEKIPEIILAGMEYTEAPALPKMCDPAIGGVTMTFNNEAVAAMLRAFVEFVDGNPAVKNIMDLSGEYYTEEELQEMWSWFQGSELYANEEEFRADYLTVEAAVKNAYETVADLKLFNGDFVAGLYLNEVGEPVYGTMQIPMADGEETELMEVIYTRQTLGEGVSYVINMTVDGETVTIDALSNDAATVINMYAPSGDKVLDLTVYNAGDNKMKTVFNACDGENVVFTVQLEGEWEDTDVRSSVSGKMTVSTPEEGVVFVMGVHSDYALDGENFSGATDVSVDSQGIGVTVRIASETMATQPSIKSGEVLRLVELDAVALQAWFESVMTNGAAVLFTAMAYLPESMLMLLLSAMGMM